MNNKIKIGIVGYGNLGRGVEAAVTNSPDMELVGVFSRRASETVTTLTGATVYPYDMLLSAEKVLAGEAAKGFPDIDVLIICAGSATDLPTMTPQLAGFYNVVDSFDTHVNIPKHLNTVDMAAISSGKTAVISTGWDPGLFSLARLYANAALPDGSDYTFWGRGVSQGHSDAIRRIEGVLDARQYTVPIQSAMDRVRSGETPNLTTREKHLRECYVVAEEGADLERIESEIKTMPNYFADYDTTVAFISAEELASKHAGLPHGGSVLRSGNTGLNDEYSNTIEFKLDLESNPYFTGSVLTACARAAYRMNEKGEIGCKTVFDIPPIFLLPGNREEIIAHML